MKIKRALEIIVNTIRLVIGFVLGLAVVGMLTPLYIIDRIIEKLKEKEVRRK